MLASSYWLCCFRFVGRQGLPQLLLVSLLMTAQPAAAFSALAHLAVIDSCWARGLVLVLEDCYPGATPAQLREARSYAYGGALLQDRGYFPGNPAFFSQLTHYVRTGDFVRALLNEACDRNELAFALGALSHYAADAAGHPAGADAVTDLAFPELRPRLGSRITYAQAPHQHTQVEYAFDVAQVRAGNYRSSEFHAAIGLRVSEGVLARAFLATYGLPLRRVPPHARVGAAACRLVATNALPAAVRASQYVPPAQLRRLPRADQQRYYAHVNSPAFRRRTGERAQLSLQMQVLGPLVPVLGKVGVVRLLAFHPLSPTAEATMRAAFAASLSCYRAQLAHLHAPLPNLNLDTGKLARAADYSLADRTYARWVGQLVYHRATSLAAAGQTAIQAFYAGDQPSSVRDQPFYTKF